MDNPNEVFNTTPNLDPIKALMRAKANVMASQNKPQVEVVQPEILQRMETPQTAGASAQMQSPFSQKFKVSQKFGNKSDLYKGVTKDSTHKGVDFATPVGTQIKSPIAGDVEVGNNKWYGNYVKIKAPDGTAIQFSHLSNVDDLLKQIEQKKQVLAGQLLGLSGNTGYSTGPHVDVMAWRGGQLIDPMTLEAIRNSAI